MAKRKKAQPWDAVFDQLRVSQRSPEAVCIPSVTDPQLDEVEVQLGSQLPQSYRVFMKRFGAGGLCSGWAGLLPVVPLGKSRDGSVVERTRARRKLYRDKPKLATNHEWLAGLVYFAVNESGDEYTWDPAEVTSANPHECRFYWLQRLREDNPIPAGATFGEFIQGVDAYVRSWREPDADSAAVAGIDFFQASLRRKAEPKKRDVKLWLAFNNNTARDLALAIRDRGQTDAFPILADALQEAGCTNADLLDSCRTGDPDIDGAWVLQVLLGRAAK